MNTLLEIGAVSEVWLNGLSVHLRTKWLCGCVFESRCSKSGALRNSFIEDLIAIYFHNNINKILQ